MAIQVSRSRPRSDGRTTGSTIAVPSANLSADTPAGVSVSKRLCAIAAATWMLALVPMIIATPASARRFTRRPLAMKAQPYR
jgi:hypothetical protein